ncbi:MAG: aldehyde dehydrogenase family protein, partial [Actinomycetota bacterium]|nr:aldehyde dehydrogenase family protein [Actinomycetota bacterium]
MMNEATQYSMYIAGEWIDSESGVRTDATSPVTGERIGSVPEGTRKDVKRAVAAANKASHAWAALSAFERATAMKRVAGVVDKRREDLARTLT